MNDRNVNFECIKAVVQLEIKSWKNEEKQSSINVLCEDDYTSVYTKYLLQNKPFVFTIDQSTWRCYKEWVMEGKPNFDYLLNKFGSATVPVANCKVKYYNSQEKKDFIFSDYLSYWKEYIRDNYPEEMKCLYLKDWHFTRDFPEENVYVVPKHFSSDWLNEYFTSKPDINDDYRFIYMGPKGSWTPFHADVFSSFSWSANICGCKRWLLFPPGEETLLRDHLGNLLYNVDKDELLHPSDKKSPVFYEIIQKAGQGIFVPSGWHHQVWNLEDTISINHNWINACNINTVWLTLQQNLAAVRKEISDCKDMAGWEDHCQLMLKASFGIDYLQFYDFLKHIADKRLSMIDENFTLTMFGGWVLGINHALYDLMKIEEVISDMMQTESFKSLDFFSENFSQITEFVDRLKRVTLEYKNI